MISSGNAAILPLSPYLLPRAFDGRIIFIFEPTIFDINTEIRNSATATRAFLLVAALCTDVIASESYSCCFCLPKNQRPHR